MCNPDGPNVISVVGAAIVRDGRCLAALRSPSMAEPARWEFPGGKVEHGETPEAALRREIAEELGIEIEVGAKLGRGCVDRGDTTICLDVYAARLVRGEPQAFEHSALRWVDAEALCTLQW